MDKLTVQADIAVGSRGNPTVTNTLRNMAEVMTCSVVYTRCYLLLPASLSQIMIKHLQSCYQVLVKVCVQCLCHTWCISLCPKGNRLVCIILLPLTALQAASCSISAGCKMLSAWYLPWYHILYSMCLKRQPISILTCMSCTLQIIYRLLPARMRHMCVSEPPKCSGARYLSWHRLLRMPPSCLSSLSGVTDHLPPSDREY